MTGNIYAPGPTYTVTGGINLDGGILYVDGNLVVDGGISGDAGSVVVNGTAIVNGSGSLPFADFGSGQGLIAAGGVVLNPSG